MRLWLVLAIITSVPTASLAQSTPPPWPKISFTTCPNIGQTLDPNKRAWTSQTGAKTTLARRVRCRRRRITLLQRKVLPKFEEQYPDSDYRYPALVLDLQTEGYLREDTGTARVAEQIIRLKPVADAGVRVFSFVALVTALSTHGPGRTIHRRNGSLPILRYGLGVEGKQWQHGFRTPNSPQEAFPARFAKCRKAIWTARMVS